MSEGKDPAVRLLQALIDKIAGPNASQTELYPYCLRILSSRLGSTQLQDDILVVETAKKKRLNIKPILLLVAHESRFHDAATLAELHQRLVSKRTLRNPTAVLHLLATISNQSQNQTTTAPGLQPTLISSSLSNVDSLLNRMQVKESSKEKHMHYDIASSRSSVPPSTAASGSTISVDVRQNQMQSSLPFQDFQRIEKTFLEVPEEYLIRDLVFVLHGVEGKYITYDQSLDAYCVDPSIGVPRPIKDLIRRCTEVGWIYRRINTFLQLKTSESSIGLITQSLCSFIKQDLLEYYRLVAVLEGQMISSSTPVSRLGAEQTNSNAITLRRMFVWLQGPLQKIKMIATLIDMCQGKKGGAVLSTIYNHSNTGDPVMRLYVESVLKGISDPLYLMIKKWMFEGELQDPFQEFFVEADSKAITGESLWTSKYKLREDMLPAFISKALAEKILLIGKSINFIRYCCKDTQWIKDSGLQSYEKSSTLEYGTTTLEKTVEQISDATNKRLVEILFSKYKLESHFSALKRYLLLGQGDFVQYLIDLLSEAVQKGGLSPTMAMRNLRQDFSSILESAIRGSNAQYDDPEILDRLDVKMEDVRESENVLDVFSLEYNVNLPINVVLNEEAMKKYGSIFQSLWKLKRMENYLNMIWQSQIGMSRVLRSWVHLGPFLRRCQVLRTEMVHFVDNLNYYVMFEVLECAWVELQTNQKKATDLDQLIKAHEKYLNWISDNLLLREMHGKESPGGFKGLFREIFRVIMQFHDFQRDFTTAALEEYAEYQSREQMIEERARQGKWGENPAQMKAQIHGSVPNTAYFMSLGYKRCPTSGANERIGRLATEYREHMRQFIQKIHGALQQGGPQTEGLRFLLFRLNFNEFYEAREMHTSVPSIPTMPATTGPLFETRTEASNIGIIGPQGTNTIGRRPSPHSRAQPGQ